MATENSEQNIKWAIHYFHEGVKGCFEVTYPEAPSFECLAILLLKHVLPDRWPIDHPREASKRSRYKAELDFRHLELAGCCEV